MIFAVESLPSFDCIFKLKLKFGVIGRKFEGNLVNQLGSQSKMRPALDVFVLFVLQPVLAPPEELKYLLLYGFWVIAVADFLNNGFVHFVHHKSERFWLRRGRYLADELVSKLVLQARLFEEEGTWAHVEYTVVFFTYREKAKSTIV